MTLLPLFAAILPFILWGVELFLPYPYLIEEPAKAILIYFVLASPKTSQKIYSTLIIGFLFAFSENVLYIFNIFSSDTFPLLLHRALLTLPMHLVTSLLILEAGLINKRLIFLGLLGAILLHYLFNMVVS